MFGSERSGDECYKNKQTLQHLVVLWSSIYQDGR